MLITGSSCQTLAWNAENVDGWMSYPRNIDQQEHAINQRCQPIVKTEGFNKPFMQPLYVVLQKNEDYKPQPIPLGFRIGINHLVDHLHQLKDIGVNHLALNLRFNALDIQDTLEQIALKALPHFHTPKKEQLPT